VGKIEEALKKARAERKSTYDIDKKALVKNSMHETSTIMHIPVMPENKIVSKQKLAELKIIYQEMQNQNILNEFRALRATILQKTKGKNISLLVYSTEIDGGTSYIAINLATAIALDKQKTALLLNCNFNETPDYESLVENNERGLIDYLTEGIDLAKVIHHTGIPKLRIIPAGSKAHIDDELFTKNKMQYLLLELKNRYADRIVVIDAPPITESADLKLLTESIDYALLVIPYAKTKTKKVHKAINIIGKEKIIGAVINNIPDIFQ